MASNSVVQKQYISDVLAPIYLTLLQTQTTSKRPLESNKYLRSKTALRISIATIENGQATTARWIWRPLL